MKLRTAAIIGKATTLMNDMLHFAPAPDGRVDATMARKGLDMEKLSNRDTRARKAGEYIERGLDCHRQGDKGEAVRFYQMAVHLDPSNVVGHYALGLALKALGNTEEALAEWRTAVGSRQGGDMADWARMKARALLARYSGEDHTVRDLPRSFPAGLFSAE